MTIFEMSMSGGLLIAVILLLRRPLLHRVPKWTFLLLWAAALCRLLIPFSLPSQFSVYTGTERIIQALQQEDEVPAHFDASPSLSVTVHSPAVVVPPAISPPATVTPALPELEEPLSPAAVLYGTGAALCGLFFGTAYLWSLRRFWGAVPADRSFIRRWQEAHSTLFPIRVRVSRAVNAPLAYGLFRSVILLPETTDWSDEGQLTYVLTHEYIHIRRGDLFWKLLLVAALCVHWCNPLVWAMYFCANRDLELACDEAVIRVLGLNSRKGYALSLLSAAESGFFPLCTTYNSKNQTEERIRAIMKTKKQSLAAILIAALLVTSVTAVFATSKAPPEDLNHLPQAAQSDTDPRPASVDKSTLGDRVPVTPADTSTPDDSRVDPFIDQPASPSADTSQNPVETVSAPEKSSAYPVNSKGHTYGAWTEADGYEDVPDLIYVRWNSETEGYLNRNEVYPYSWPISSASTQAELQRYVDWYHKLTQYDNPNVNYVPYEEASFSLYDREESGVIGSCAGFEAYSRPDGHKLSDEALMELVTQGNPVKWSLFLGTAPVENIPDASIQPFREVPKTEEERALLEQWTENGDWRRNSKGQTYGPYSLGHYVGYFPDLICRTASNGQEGYELLKDFCHSGYPGDIRRPEDTLDYMEWLETQPYLILLPVYDLEFTHVIGYTEVQNTRSEEYVWPEDEIEYRLNILENKFREWGLSDEEVARQLEEYKQSQDWK
jgi:beta-lactamase regulating signal transducer with metallopeptidase domain